MLDNDEKSIIFINGEEIGIIIDCNNSIRDNKNELIIHSNKDYKSDYFLYYNNVNIEFRLSNGSFAKCKALIDKVEKIEEFKYCFNIKDITDAEIHNSLYTDESIEKVNR